MTEEEYDVEMMFYNYFKNLFSTTRPSNIKWDVKMTKEMNDHLDKPFIEMTYQQLWPKCYSASRDGFPAAFFQKH